MWNHDPHKCEAVKNLPWVSDLTTPIAVIGRELVIFNLVQDEENVAQRTTEDVLQQRLLHQLHWLYLRPLCQLLLLYFSFFDTGT